MKRIPENHTFLEYVTQWRLLPKSLSSAIPNENTVVPDNTDTRWFDIPSYQRGLVWDEDLFDNLLCHQSLFLGNVIFVELPVGDHREKIGNISAEIKQYSIVIDGLQRFSVGTALLNVLYPLYLSDNPDVSGSAPELLQLKKKCSGLESVYIHNDMELRNHHHKAISESYEKFVAKLRKCVNEQRKEKKDFVKFVESLLLKRMITTDIYTGFKSPYELTNTFIGLNVNRVQGLSPK